MALPTANIEQEVHDLVHKVSGARATVAVKGNGNGHHVLKPHQPEKEGPERLDAPPHSVETEENVLGATLMNPESLVDTAPLLQGTDFYIVRHGWIWDAMLALYERRWPIDYRTLAEELRKQSDPTHTHDNRLEAIGGEAYLNYLPMNVPTSLHAEIYARIVKTAALQRVLLGVAGQIGQLAYAENMDLEGRINRAQELVFNIDLSDLKRHDESFDDVTRRVFDQLGDYRLGIGDMGIDTPLKDLNKVIGGYFDGELVVIAALPKAGKTSFLLQCANRAAKAGKRVKMFSLEMLADSLVRRVIAQETGITFNDQRSMTDSQWERFVNWYETQYPDRRQIFFDTQTLKTPMQITTSCRRTAREGGLDLVIVDYLQLLSSDTRQQNRNYEIGGIVQTLKEMALELKIPVIVASQFNRAAAQGGKRPVWSQLRDSGTIEQALDKAIFLHNPNQDDKSKHNREVIVDLNRNGETGIVNAAWIGERMMFHDLSHQTERTP